MRRNQPHLTGKILSISNKNVVLHHWYYIEEIELERVETYRDLGLIYDSTLTFDAYINKIVYILINHWTFLCVPVETLRQCLHS